MVEFFGRRAVYWPVFRVFFLAAILLGPGVAGAGELSGYLAVESRLFCQTPLDISQKRNNRSLVLESEYYHEWSNDLSFIAKPFGRLDNNDGSRSHVDFRELHLLKFAETWELRVGISKVFWGATEFVHLVDIVNQTDLVEGPDGEDKLGQPMVHLSLPRDWGTMDFFWLPLFRERTLPGTRGRLRNVLVVDTDRPVYENGGSRHDSSYSVRYTQVFDDLDLGLSHFMGTGREPVYTASLNGLAKPILLPNYVQIQQTGLDLQLVAGRWLLKFEGLHRTGQGKGFWAGVGGFEYNIPSVFASGIDLGFLVELARDSRGDEATTMFEHDLMAGLRLVVNDPASTEILVGLGQDLHGDGRVLSVEASRRIGDSLKLTVEGAGFFGIRADDLLYDRRDDDYVRLELAWYF